MGHKPFGKKYFYEEDFFTSCEDELTIKSVILLMMMIMGTDL